MSLNIPKCKNKYVCLIYYYSIYEKKPTVTVII